MDAIVVEDLHKRYKAIQAVDGVSFSLARGEVLGIAGESGCGKSSIARSVLAAVDRPGRVVGGRVLFEGRDLLQMSERELRWVRGRRIGVVVQDPVSGFDPLFTIGQQLVEVLQAHLNLSGRAARERAVDLLRRVHISEPPRRMDQYPHELSGGMRQRIALAMAVACEPALIVAVTNVEVRPEMVAMYHDRKRAIENRVKDDETAIVYLELTPGGMHLMFVGLKQPLKQGQKLKGTLVFEKAGTIQVEFAVRGIGASGGPRGRQHH